MNPNNKIIKDHILYDEDTNISKTIISLEWHIGEVVVISEWNLNKVTGEDSTIKSYVTDETQKEIYLSMLRRIA